MPNNESVASTRRKFLGDAGSGLILAGGAMNCANSQEKQTHDFGILIWPSSAV